VIEGFQSGRTRTRWATGGLLLAMVGALWAISADASRLQLALRVLGGQEISLDAAHTSDIFVAVTAFSEAALLVVAVVLFLVWLYRAVSNANRLAFWMRFTPGWAVGWFFIPIANLFRPLQVVREVWRVCDPSPAAGTAAGRRDLRVSPLVPVWWAAWLLSDIVGGAVAVSTERPTSVVDIRNLALAGLVTDALLIASLFTTILLVRRVEAREVAKAAALARAATLAEEMTETGAPQTAWTQSDPTPVSGVPPAGRRRLLVTVPIGVASLALIAAPLLVGLRLGNSAAIPGEEATVPTTSTGVAAPTAPTVPEQDSSSWAVSNTAAKTCSDRLFQPSGAVSAGLSSTCAHLTFGAALYRADCTRGVVPAGLATGAFDGNGHASALGSVKAVAGACDLSTRSATATAFAFVGNSHGPTDEPGSVIVVTDFVPPANPSAISFVGLRISAAEQLDIAISSSADYAVLEGTGASPATLLQGNFNSDVPAPPDLTRPIRVVAVASGSTVAVYVNGRLIGAGPTTTPDLPGACGFSVTADDISQPVNAKLLRFDVFAVG